MKLKLDETGKIVNVKLYADEYLGGFLGPLSFAVPVDPGNSEYKDILRRNLIIEDFSQNERVVPQSISPLQARKSLRDFGVYEVFKEMMGQASEEVQEEWEYCSAVERNHPLIIQFSQILGLSDYQVDDMFILAASL